MQIVIEVDDNLYNRIKYLEPKADTMLDKLMRSIQNGTLLTKGHGDLKDIGECDRKLFYQQCGGADSLITVKTAFDMLLSLPTIIEADKGSENP